MDESHPRRKEMEEKDLIYVATAKKEKNGYALEIALHDLSSIQAVEIATTLLFNTVEQVCKGENGQIEPMELLVAELEIHHQQDKFRKEMVKRMESRYGARHEGSVDDELSRLLAGLEMAMKLKRNSGL